MIRNQALICALRLTCLITMMTVAGCGHRSSTLGGADLVIASKSFPESQLLAEIMAQLIEAQTELRVDRKEGLGGTMVCFEALRTGQVDIYPEYTGTGLLSILKQQLGDDRSSDTIYAEVKNQFESQYDLAVLGRFGFNNTYVLAARPALDVKTISDLQPLSDSLRVRFQHEFLERGDGYPAIQRVYGITFRDVQGMEHGLAYTAIAEGQIDVMDAYSTDGTLVEYKDSVTLLQDDRQLFPPYDAFPLVNSKTLESHPELIPILAKLESAISREEMTSMNYDVLKQASIPEIASTFLIAEGLIDPALAVKETWWDDVVYILKLLGQHMFLTLTATGLATVFGIGIGLLVARHEETLAGPLLGAVGVLQTIPSLALLAFLIPVFGIGMRPAIFALFLYGLLPIVRNTYTGIISVPADLKDAGIGMGMTRGQLLWQLELPLSAKTIMAGIRTALVISVGTATLGAFIGAGGFGDPIFAGLQQKDNGKILLGATASAILALTCDYLMACLEKRLGPKGLEG